MTISDASPIQFWSVDDDTFNEKEVCSINTACFCLPFLCSDTINIPLTDPVGDETLVAFDSAGGQLGSPLAYSNGFTFIPDEDWPQLCGQQVQFKVLNGSAEIVYKSDCVDIQTVHECTELITYSNSKILAGIDYTLSSPPPEYNIRIPAIFFQERFPDEQEGIDLSDSRIVRLRNQVKAQKYLDIGFMPFYMHKKLQIIFTHDTIEIGGESWVKSENYEIVDGNKRYPLRKATIWLTNKNYILRNVL